MMDHSLLDDAVFSIIDRASQKRSRLTLPGVFAALVRNEVDDFPALRPHQRHVWHAFLVQVGALHLHRSGLTELPDADGAWKAALLSLTPDDPDGAAWALVSPLDRPAFLQPPVPELSLKGFKRVAAPDDLDMLVAAKNHDVKRETIRSPDAEYWTLALLSLQTQEGFLGAGNYGISRMNGGFASRPGIGIAPSGGSGRRFVRDVQRLLELRSSLLEEYDAYPSSEGRALLWIYPWDGAASMPVDALDLFYLEVCRRVRLCKDEHGRLQGWTKGTKAARIDAKALKGRTGDGWTPLLADGAERKALTIDPGSFGYKRITSLLFPRSADPSAATRAPLQKIGGRDDEAGLALLARGIVRGQGKTEGYHERRIPVSTSMRRFLVERPTDDAAEVASSLTQDAGTMARKVLYPAALAVFTAAPLDGERKRDDDTAKKRAGRVLDAFDKLVDQTFFDALSDELAVLDNPVRQEAMRARWISSLMVHARGLLDLCARSAPSAAMRAYRTRARSRDVLEYSFRKHFGDRIPKRPDATDDSTSGHVDAAPANTTPPQS